MVVGAVYISIVALSATFMAPILPWLSDHNPRVSVHLADEDKLAAAGYVRDFDVHPSCARLKAEDFAENFYETEIGRDAVRDFGEKYRSAPRMALLYSRLGVRQQGLTGIGKRDSTQPTANELKAYNQHLREHSGFLPPRPSRLLDLMLKNPGFGYNTTTGHARSALKHPVWVALETLPTVRKLTATQQAVRAKYFPGTGSGEVIACVVKCLESSSSATGQKEIYWSTRAMQVSLGPCLLYTSPSPRDS